MEENYFRKIMTAIILGILLVLSFFLLKPILLAIVLGVILAFIFTPVYESINKKLKSKNLSAAIICVVLIILLILPVWFFTPIIIDQSFKMYQASQQVDFVSVLQKILPSVFRMYPARIFIRVLLPAPFSPRMPWIVPGATVSEMPLLARTGP